MFNNLLLKTLSLLLIKTKGFTSLHQDERKNVLCKVLVSTKDNNLFFSFSLEYKVTCVLEIYTCF